MQQSQAKDFADRVKYLTRDTAIRKQRMPENQRENADEQISSTPSSSSGNQSRKGHRTNQFKNYLNVVALMSCTSPCVFCCISRNFAFGGRSVTLLMDHGTMSRVMF